jgi:hypothetical protein
MEHMVPEGALRILEEVAMGKKDKEKKKKKRKEEEDEKQNDPAYLQRYHSLLLKKQHDLLSTLGEAHLRLPAAGGLYLWGV